VSDCWSTMDATRQVPTRPNMLRSRCARTAMPVRSCPLLLRPRALPTTKAPRLPRRSAAPCSGFCWSTAI
jgi:hypothetical protein